MSATKDLPYVTALLSIVHSEWPDIEEAKNIAAQIAFFADLEIEKIRWGNGPAPA
jgi:hypothetical protein